MENRLLRKVRRALVKYNSKPHVMRNAGPIVSITFDDVPESACLNGRTVLEDLGVRGTYYVAAGLCGAVDPKPGWRLASRDQVRATHRAGHEIGCHTYSHVPVDRLASRAMADECRRNRDALIDLCDGQAPTNFCYPFGRASPFRKRQLETRFDSCRGIGWGINARVADLGLLKVMELYDRTVTPERLAGLLDKTVASNGWLILYAHDVADDPTWIGCSPRVLRDSIRAIRTAGLPCLTVREALAAIGYVRPAGLGEPFAPL